MVAIVPSNEYTQFDLFYVSAANGHAVLRMRRAVNQRALVLIASGHSVL